MTQSGASVEGQLDCLRYSVQSLAALCSELPLSPDLSARLSSLASCISSSAARPTRMVAPTEAIELISQSRSSLKLLVAADCLLDGDPPGLVSQLRCALNDLERAVGQRLREGPNSRTYGLYVIVDPEVTAGRDSLEVAEGALKGGARMVQLRDKLREKGQTLSLAYGLKELCARFGALLIVNDHADLAALVESDGLHVGQGDLPVDEARRILWPHQIIGRSNHLVEEALESECQGADHVAVGAVYPTSTKASIKSRAPTGPEAIRRVKEAVNVPVVAIGGINEKNVGPVVRAGADAICVTSAVGLANDPEAASRRLVERIRQAGGRG